MNALNCNVFYDLTSGEQQKLQGGCGSQIGRWPRRRGVGQGEGKGKTGWKGKEGMVNQMGGKGLVKEA